MNEENIMKKLIPVLLSALLLSGCNVDATPTPSGDPGTDPSGSDPKELTSVVLIEQMSTTQFPVNSQISDHMDLGKSYLNRNEANLVNFFTCEAVGATENGMNKLIWTVGSSKRVGSFVINFNKPIKSVYLKVAAHQKYYSGSITAFSSYGKVTFDNQTTEFKCEEFDMPGQYNYKEFRLSSEYGVNRLAIESVDVSKHSDANDYRVGIHNLTVGY